MKKTDLAKNKGLRIVGKMRQAGSPERFAAGAAVLVDRRAQRRLDQLAGLVPFATKLPHALVRQLNDRATAEGISLHELTASLLQASLGATPSAVQQAATKPAAGKTIVQKVALKKVASKEVRPAQALAPDAVPPKASNAPKVSKA